MKIEVPFYSNTKDNTHCFQAMLKMVLKYFMPEKDFSFEELDKITAKVDDLWTWPSAGLLWMQEQGFEIIDIETFDYKEFVKTGQKYLLEACGEEVGKAQIENSNIEQERKLAKEFMKKIKIEKRIPNLEDIKKLLERGFLVFCNVNSFALNEMQGYLGHMILVIGFNEHEFIIHDPGLPPIQNRKVKYEIFEKAWAYPEEDAKNIVAFKLKN